MYLTFNVSYSPGRRLINWNTKWHRGYFAYDECSYDWYSEAIDRGCYFGERRLRVGPIQFVLGIKKGKRSKW
jgi:hypothetical protein